MKSTKEVTCADVSRAVLEAAGIKPRPLEEYWQKRFSDADERVLAPLATASFLGGWSLMDVRSPQSVPSKLAIVRCMRTVFVRSDYAEAYDYLRYSRNDAAWADAPFQIVLEEPMRVGREPHAGMPTEEFTLVLGSLRAALGNVREWLERRSA